MMKFDDRRKGLTESGSTKTLPLYSASDWRTFEFESSSSGRLLGCDASKDDPIAGDISTVIPLFSLSTNLIMNGY